jgi:hypothetical protein
MEERTITLSSKELMYTSKIYSLIGRRFLNKYNVNRFYNHILGKTEVKAFSERILAKVSPDLKVYDALFEDSTENGEFVRNCKILILNTSICKRIYYCVEFFVYHEKISWRMLTGLFSENIVFDDETEDGSDSNNEDNDSVKAS